MTLLLIFISAVLSTALLTPVCARWAWRFGVVDLPQSRKQHESPVALLGGAAVLASLTLCTAGIARIVATGSRADRPLGTEAGFLAGCFCGAAVLAVVGLWDDIRPLPISVKLAAQLAAAGVLLAFSRPASVAAAAAALVWLVIITNSFNLVDNMDGAAPGVGALAAGFYMVLAGTSAVSLACAALAGALIGFLIYNWHPASVFLGDGGSLPIGFVLGAVGLWLGGRGGSLAAVILVPGVLILDTGLVVVSRLRRRLNPLTTPGRDHLSHRLVALGMPTPVAVVVLWVLGLLGGLAGLAVAPPPVVEPWIVVAIAAAVWFGVILFLECAAPVGLAERAEAADPDSGEAA